MARSDNSKNLRSLRDRTPEERKRIASMGGKASAEKRWKDVDLRYAMNTLMGMRATGKAKQMLDDMGYSLDDQQNANAVAAKLFSMALNGNPKAMEMLLEYFFKQSEDDRKTKESNARIDALKKNGVDISVDSKDDDDGGVVIYLPEIEKEEQEEKKEEGQ